VPQLKTASNGLNGAVDGFVFGLVGVIAVPVTHILMGAVSWSNEMNTWTKARLLLSLLPFDFAFAIVTVLVPSLVVGWVVFWIIRSRGLMHSSRGKAVGCVAGCFVSFTSQLIASVILGCLPIPDSGSPVGLWEASLSSAGWLARSAWFTIPLGGAVGWVIARRVYRSREPGPCAI
jgi:hypothetical protein